MARATRKVSKAMSNGENIRRKQKLEPPFLTVNFFRAYKILGTSKRSKLKYTEGKKDCGILAEQDRQNKHALISAKSHFGQKNSLF